MVFVTQEKEEIASELHTLYPEGGLAHYFTVSLPNFGFPLPSHPYAWMVKSSSCTISIYISLASHPYQRNLNRTLPGLKYHVFCC